MASPKCDNFFIQTSRQFLQMSQQYSKVKDVSPKLPTKSWQEVRNQVHKCSKKHQASHEGSNTAKDPHHFISAINFSYSASAP